VATYITWKRLFQAEHEPGTVTCLSSSSATLTWTVITLPLRRWECFWLQRSICGPRNGGNSCAKLHIKTISGASS